MWMIDGNKEGDAMTEFVFARKRWVLAHCGLTGVHRRYARLKVYALDPVYGKANYHLAFKISAKQIVQCFDHESDFENLILHRRELFIQVRDYLASNAGMIWFSGLVT